MVEIQELLQILTNRLPPSLPLAKHNVTLHPEGLMVSLFIDTRWFSFVIPPEDFEKSAVEIAQEVLSYFDETRN